jgi:Fur family transcriptional regulator, zinc uptake regulator
MARHRQMVEGHGGRSDDEVLRVLRFATAPMGVYAILEALRDTNVTAPITIHRALSRLMQNGLFHRLESLNAYVICRGGHQHGPIAFVICRDCGRVDELCDADVIRRLDEDASRLGFLVEAAIIELTGRCAACAG